MEVKNDTIKATSGGIMGEISTPEIGNTIDASPGLEKHPLADQCPIIFQMEKKAQGKCDAPKH
jgi:hypothetical protein